MFSGLYFGLIWTCSEYYREDATISIMWKAMVTDTLSRNLFLQVTEFVFMIIRNVVSEESESCDIFYINVLCVSVTIAFHIMEIVASSL
jgi:hypothetical protein